MEVRFPISSGNFLPDDVNKTMEQIKLMEWEKERLSEDMQREEVLLSNVKTSFDFKKQQFVKYLGENSPFVTQVLPKAYHTLLIKFLSFFFFFLQWIKGSQIIIGCLLNLDNIKTLMFAIHAPLCSQLGVMIHL